MNTIEIEKTFLAARIPEELLEVNPVSMKDIYIPENNSHAHLRLRARGSKYEITKKVPVIDGDASSHVEQTIALEEEEFVALSTSSRKTVEKNRYHIEIDGHKAEVDVFKGILSGLVLIDFEFANPQALSDFKAPDVCLADVTDEELLAGGVLSGKSYSDLETVLSKYNYVPLLS